MAARLHKSFTSVENLQKEIAERKQAEAEKAKLEAQLLQSQKMEAIGQLAGGVAHDFNNILAAITGFGFLLNLQLEGNDKGTQYVSEILHATDRAAVLTQSLLAFSRKQHINPQPMDLNATIQKTEQILARTIGEDIHLSLQLTEENTSVCADSNQITQILINLAANARDAMPKGGALTIRTARTFIDEAFMKIHGYGSSGEYVVMTVEDSGMGMDAATRKRVFEPFFTTKEVGKGTGLGLSMVYGIVKQHNGFIDVYSEEGTGTTFKVYLPALETRAEAQESNGHFEHEGATETILVVEDDNMVRRALTEMLQSVGHTVIEACDGDDAVTKFLAHKDEIHLVLMDVIMPRKSGGDAYQELKAIQPDMKLIFMSGYAGDYLTGKLGMEEDLHFISKPVSPKELFEKIRSVLSGGKA
jgi:signal transduction histidine kinase/CheY-like chemotaxis protein